MIFFKLFFVRIKIVLQRYGFKTFFTTVGSWLDTQGCRTREGGQGDSVWAITPSQILADPLTLSGKADYRPCVIPVINMN